MGVVSAVNVLRELADEQRAALTRTMRALEILEGGEVVGDAESATTSVPSETSPVSPPAQPTSRPKTAASKAPAVRAGTPDYDAIAHVVNTRLPTQSMKEAILSVYKVPDTTVSNWMHRLRQRGMIVDRTAPIASDAIAPAEIRHEVEPVPEAIKITHEDRIEPIAPTSGDSYGFASRPAVVPREIETERNGWKPGMGAAAIAGGIDGAA